MKRTFNLESYDIEPCPLCNNPVKFPENLDGFSTCIKCGGLGFIMNKKQASRRKQK